MREIFTGGMTGIVGGIAGKKLEKVTGDIPYLAENGEELHNDIRTMCAHLQYLCHKDDDTIRKPFYQAVVLQPATLIPMYNDSHHRAYNMALVTSAVDIQFQVASLGQAFTLSLTKGWNVLNMPDDTQWGLPSNATGNTTLLYCASDAMFGSAI